MTISFEIMQDVNLLAQVQDDAARYGPLFGCPIVNTLEVIRHKWAIQLLYCLYLAQTPVRYNQIERTLAPITQRELTKRLRELEYAGVVSRTVYAEVPPHVIYQLTKSGLALIPILQRMTEWAKIHHPAVAED